MAKYIELEAKVIVSSDSQTQRTNPNTTAEVEQKGCKCTQVT